MSFKSKQDYFGLSGTGSNFVITSSDENKSASTAEAQNDKGDIVATQMYGVTSTPSCDYVLKGDASTGDIEMGNEITVDDKKYVITSFSFNTAAGTPPTVNVSGEEVPANSHCSSDCYYDVPSATLVCCHHAQPLWDITWSDIGSGFYVTQANYTVECELTKATKDGETVSYDITGGKMTAQLTIQGTGGSGTPNITAPTGWIITSPLSQSNPDSAYETYSITLTKNLVHHTTTTP